MLVNSKEPSWQRYPFEAEMEDAEVNDTDGESRHQFLHHSKSKNQF